MAADAVLNFVTNVANRMFVDNTYGHVRTTGIFPQTLKFCQTTQGVDYLQKTYGIIHLHFQHLCITWPERRSIFPFL